jgi:ABC-type lipoprotein release transport system permease subunit
MMLWRLAYRNLTRNRTRTLLAIGGIAVATILLIWNKGFIDGFYQLMIRGVTDVELGHVQIQHQDYVERPSPQDYFQWNPALADALVAVPEVRAVAPRVRLFGIVGHEERSNVGLILGIDPRRESGVTVMDQGLDEGRWLSDRGGEGLSEGVVEAVIGRGLSRTLGVGVGDELVLIAEGVDGSMGDALLEVIGVVSTGNSIVDRQAVILDLAEAQYVAAMEGSLHEVVIAVGTPSDAPRVARAVQERLDELGREELQARPWQEIAKGLSDMLEITDQSNYVTFVIIFVIVGLGVLNALRMSARERYREFGVMLAVGFSRTRLFAMVLLEGVVLGLLGGLVGAVLGGGLTWYYATYGLDFGVFLEGEATYMGVSFTDRIFFVMDGSTVFVPALGLVVVTVICAIWPAVASIRLNPRDAITGRQ